MGDEEGFVGLDKDKCISQLKNFVEACASVNEHLNEVLRIFNEALKYNWYSPAAFDKNTKFARYYTNIHKEVQDLCDTVVNNAIGSIRYLAIKNQDDFHPSIDLDVGKAYEWVNLDQHGAKGVGMNKKRITEVIIPDFKEGIESVVDSLDQLPQDLTVYDETGTILKTYRELIVSAKSRLKYYCTWIPGEIINVIETEKDNLQIGVVEATNRMSA